VLSGCVETTHLVAVPLGKAAGKNNEQRCDSKTVAVHRTKTVMKRKLQEANPAINYDSNTEVSANHNPAKKQTVANQNQNWSENSSESCIYSICTCTTVDIETSQFYHSSSGVDSSPCRNQLSCSQMKVTKESLSDNSFDSPTRLYERAECITTRIANVVPISSTYSISSTETSTGDIYVDENESPLTLQPAYITPSYLRYSSQGHVSDVRLRSPRVGSAHSSPGSAIESIACPLRDVGVTPRKPEHSKTKSLSLKYMCDENPTQRTLVKVQTSDDGVTKDSKMVVHNNIAEINKTNISKSKVTNNNKSKKTKSDNKSKFTTSSRVSTRSNMSKIPPNTLSLQGTVYESDNLQFSSGNTQMKVSNENCNNAVPNIMASSHELVCTSAIADEVKVWSTDTADVAKLTRTAEPSSDTKPSEQVLDQSDDGSPKVVYDFSDLANFKPFIMYAAGGVHTYKKRMKQPDGTYKSYRVNSHNL